LSGPGTSSDACQLPHLRVQFAISKLVRIGESDG
jgi:hypothetical protein